MKKLKIRKDLFEAILAGDKQYEFRKLSKGLETGYYAFVSIEETFDPSNSLSFPNKYYGTAKLRPIAVNPQISGHGSKHRFYTSISNNLGYSEMCVIDKETYNFVKENYIDKGIDFIAYVISEVK